jgi:hypothetical protein
VHWVLLRSQPLACTHALHDSTLTTFVIFQTPVVGAVGVCEAACVESPAASSMLHRIACTEERDASLKHFTICST